MNAIKGLINHTTSLEVPLTNEVLALLLLESLSDSWETLVVTLGSALPEGKNLSLARVKSSLLNEEARRKDQVIGTHSKALLIETTRTGEEAETKVLKTRKSRGRGRSQRGGLLVSIAGNRGTSKRTVDTSEGIKGEPTVPNRRRFRRKEAQRQLQQAKKSCC